MLVFIESGYGGHLSPYTDSTVLQVLDAVVSISFFFALLVTFLAGLFSRGKSGNTAYRSCVLQRCGFANAPADHCQAFLGIKS